MRNVFPISLLRLAVFFVLIIIWCLPATAAENEEKAQTVVHMLDYLSVDYPNFVSNGQVLNPSEYAEQLEFATQSGKLLTELPAVPGQAALIQESEQLRRMIENKQDGAQVSSLSTKLRGDVIKTYRLTVAPRETPDLKRAATIFSSTCMACHGANGQGDGPLAASLDPHPSNFHDETRMRQRSIYGLYNTISLGVEGTPMRAFTDLSESDRWALAFYVSSLRLPGSQLAEGKQAWDAGKGKKTIGTLKELVTLSPGEVSQSGEDIRAAQAYLTVHPEALAKSAPSPLVVARSKLEQTLQAYQAGDRDTARQSAISAYLEGFELIESSLNNIAPELRLEVEEQMMKVRADIANAVSAETVAGDVAHISGLLDKTEERLSGDTLSPTAAFVSAAIILLREGLEAILVLAAIIAFVTKTGRKDAMRYIHTGWMAAVLLGVATWAAANYLLTISGASREMTEGISAMAAAVMLLYIGYWLHSKSHANAWQQFLREKITAALDQRTLWTMAGISFLAVYREIFETILFYEALWGQVGNDGHNMLLMGIGAAAVLLALITWAILKYSVRLPLGRFFSATSSLLAIMAVIFAGNGIKALQEAGVVSSTAVHFFSVPLLGIYPSAEGLGTQALTIGLIAIGILFTRRQPANAASAT